MNKKTLANHIRRQFEHHSNAVKDIVAAMPDERLVEKWMRHRVTFHRETKEKAVSNV